jgi:hypothetical protein
MLVGQSIGINHLVNSALLAQSRKSEKAVNFSPPRADTTR